MAFTTQLQSKAMCLTAKRMSPPQTEDYSPTNKRCGNNPQWARTQVSAAVADGLAVQCCSLPRCSMAELLNLVKQILVKSELTLVRRAPV